jgi:peptide/nickel transport system permease protein
MSRLLRNPSFAAGALLTGLLIAAALVSLLWTPYPTDAIAVPQRFLPRSAEHWLGTDQLGRDMVSLLMAGARNSILVGLVAVGIGMIAGVALGVTASALGGIFEQVAMRACDFGFAFPAILLAIMLAAVFGPSLVISVVAIGIINVPVFARLTRAAGNAIWVRPFVLAARATGKGRLAIALRHVLPNLAPIIIVQATIEFAVAILAEAALSYLGLGTQPPQPSWGRMLNEAQTLLFMAPQLAIYPGLAIGLTVLGLNLLGDGLRDFTDPRLTPRLRR